LKEQENAVSNEVDFSMRILCQHRQEQTKHEVMMMYNVRVAAGKQNICKKKLQCRKLLVSIRFVQLAGEVL